MIAENVMPTTANSEPFLRILLLHHRSPWSCRDHAARTTWSWRPISAEGCCSIAEATFCDVPSTLRLSKHPARDQSACSILETLQAQQPGNSFPNVPPQRPDATGTTLTKCQRQGCITHAANNTNKAGVASRP